ncbi:A-agglutinin anchorage subunit-like [Notothenia coriiceps]|uniref:A-agglutinin anchorage subunit-like n=1 Tax=Notothenia coriiceps TaxID=8208 RepID=A0A6I9MNN0_9TELE|nr:PREDICTED: A-agglutinin anchorage subunit-like [Notothenia coriiceps]
MTKALITDIRAVAITRADSTQVEVGLEFNQTASPAEIPKDDDVAKTLEEAISNPNNTFNISVDVTSIRVIPPTAIPTSTTTSAATTTTRAATTKTTTTPTTTITKATTIAEAVIIRQLTFRSAGETFTTDLQNRLSAAFKARASLIETTLNPIYQRQFSSFRSLTVILFSNGSIFNTMILEFASTSVPSGTQIGNILAGAASSITAFNIETASIFLDGAQVSNGVSHKMSLITASFLVLLSWLLSSFQ